MPRLRRNQDATGFIQRLEPFDGSNFFARRYGLFYVVYSYGHHHPLLVAHDGTGTIPSIRIVNTGRYSQSTSRHASIVRGALSDRADVFESSAEHMQTMDENIRHAYVIGPPQAHRAEQYVRLWWLDAGGQYTHDAWSAFGVQPAPSQASPAQAESAAVNAHAGGVRVF